MIKKVFFLAACLLGLLLDGYANPGFPADTAAENLRVKFLRPVKIGPSQFYLPDPPPIDSALIKRLAIDARYKQKAEDEMPLRYYQAKQEVYAYLSSRELYPAPYNQDDKQLVALYNSFCFAEDFKNQLLITNNIALAYIRTGDPASAAIYLVKSLEFQEKQKDKAALAQLAFTIGGVYKLAGNYSQAATYYNYAIRLNIEQKHISELSAAYAELASVMALQKKYADAEYYILRKALPFYRGNKAGRMSCFGKLGDLYMAQNRYSEAKWYYLQQNQLAGALNNKAEQVSSLVSVARIKNILGDHKQALLDFKTAEFLASENRYLAKLVEIKGDVGEVYLKLGDYITAGTAINEYRKLKDSLFSSAE